MCMVRWCTLAVPTWTQLQKWESRRKLVTGTGGARGARRRRASGGGCRWTTRRWRRWPAWASSPRWCARAGRQRLVVHAFDCALPHHARTLTMHLCAFGALRACAPVLDGPATHSQPVSTHAASLLRQGKALRPHTLWGHTRRQATLRAACRPSARCASAPATCPRPPPSRRTSARARARVARSSGARPPCAASRSCARPASMAAGRSLRHHGPCAACGA